MKFTELFSGMPKIARRRRTAVISAMALTALALTAYSVSVLRQSASAPAASRTGVPADTKLAGSSETSSDLFTGAGVRIAQGSSVSADGLLPLSVRSSGTNAIEVKFTLDGIFLGTDKAAPFMPDVSSIALGEHKLRYTITSANGETTKVTVLFTVTSATSASNTPSTTSSTVTPSTTTSTTANPSPTGNEVVATDAVSLQIALASAQPGMTITLTDGQYNGKDVSDPSGNEPGRFVITKSGTPNAPITLRGSRNALLDGGGTGGGYAIHVKNANNWKLEGFTVHSASKGIVLDGSDDNVIDDVRVTDIGQEGVHLRAFSSDNILRNSVVDNTGVSSPNFGEGVYIGSAVSNWPTYTGGQPDRSDRNQVLNNRIVDTAAENIDIKEGTTGGIIRGNFLGGDKIALKNSADSWIDVKGNGYLIESNHGMTAPKPGTTECGDPKGDATSLKNPFCDGLQVHVQAPGWGANNVFTKNVLEVNSPGVGIWLQNTAVPQNNVIRCDNVVTGAGAGIYAYNHYTPISCTN